MEECVKQFEFRAYSAEGNMRDATSGTGTAYNTSGAPEFNLIFSGVHTVPDLPICLAV
jgi:hypothetical protein